jgi:hypothetical protein
MSHNPTTRSSSVRSSNFETLSKRPNSHTSIRAVQSTAQHPKNPRPCSQTKARPTAQKSNILQTVPLKVPSVLAPKKPPSSGVTKVTTIKPKTSFLKNDQVQSKESSRGQTKAFGPQTKSRMSSSFTFSFLAMF